jgi:hypothetical protein
MEIRIVDVPPGEAPESVRKRWVGLVLPLAHGESGPRSLRSWGVSSGPKTLLGSLWRLLTGRYTWTYGYVVNARQALEILAQKAPEAAKWWEENTPYWQQGRKFVFHGEVCEEL